MKDLHDEGQTAVLVEQNARLVLGVADRGYVIERGNIVLEGTGRDLLDNPKCRRPVWAFRDELPEDSHERQ